VPATLSTSIFIASVVCAIGAGTGYQQTGRPPRATGDVLVYIGTYTGPQSRGIYQSRLNLATGTLSQPLLAAETQNPSFLAMHPARDVLYAVNETDKFEGGAGGSVTAFAIDRQTGALAKLNAQSSRGAGPAHLMVDPEGRNVLVANYGGGSAAVLPIGADGRLESASAVVQHAGSSVNPDRQKQPHAHSINLDRDGHRAFVADLGIDKVMIYRYDATKGTLTANDPPFAAVEPGAGPRHFAFHPSGRFAYVINELQLTITAFSYDQATGGLAAQQTITTLPPRQASRAGYSTAEVQVHPSGRFLYGSNRGHDSITVYSIDQTTGRLTYVQNESTKGSMPRGFGIDRTGAYLLAANQRSGTIVVFRIDNTTGRLTATGGTLEVGTPVCVTFAR
jgi:6-phosphogluconolactonase